MAMMSDRSIVLPQLAAYSSMRSHSLKYSRAWVWCPSCIFLIPWRLMVLIVWCNLSV